jgi:DNA-binding response OmpR family regulator
VGASAQLVILADHPKLQQLYAHRLREHGYQIEIASDIEEAVVATIVQRPRLLIAEWLLGRSHGLELARRLQKVAAVAATPILFLTDQAALPLSIQRGDHGPIEWLVRPFPFEQLIESIERMIAPAAATTGPSDSFAQHTVESAGGKGAVATMLPGRTRAVIEELIESGLLTRREKPGNGSVERRS